MKYHPLTLLFLFILNSSLGQTILNPIADAFVSQNNSTLNYGSATTLSIFKTATSSTEKITYLKFDLSTINLTAQAKVLLRLYASAPFTTLTDIGFDVHQLNNTTWSETTINYANKPSFVKRIATAWLWNGMDYIEFDITNYAKQLVGNILSLGITDNRLSNFSQQFFSRESVNKPQLFCYTSALDTGYTYYVANSGNDSNNGLSPLSPWKTLKKVNSINFKAGSTIKFKAGDVWQGQLRPQGIGVLGNPITIDSFGIGSLPIIDGNGIQYEATVFLYNSAYFEIRNLDITNSSNQSQDRRGVEVDIENCGTINHIILSGLQIHNIKGIVGSGLSGKGTGGIYFTTLNDNILSTRFDSIIVENCTIAYCDNTGIATNSEATATSSTGWNYPGTTDFNKRKITNLIFKNNIIHHIAKNAIIVRLSENGLVEHNVCYETAIGTTGNTIFTRSSKGVVLQYNEGYYNRATSSTGGTIDGSLYDPDYGSVGCVFQYSYSHDNSEGLAWFCNCRSGANTSSGKPDPGDTGTIFRYNISQNDLGDIFFFNYPSAANSIYNNVIYVGPNLSGNFIHENSSNEHTYNFHNNIIYNKNSLKIYSFSSGAAIQNRTFSHNLFYGSHPTAEPLDPNKIIVDPQFVNPGSGSIGLQSLNGYKLKSSSPALSSGKIITNNGAKDFYGNNVPVLMAPNRGVYQGEPIQDTSLSIVCKGRDLFEVYPNPCSDYLEIKNLNYYEIDVFIIDMSGLQVKRELDKFNRLDIADLNPGIYTVLFRNKEDFRVIYSTMVLKK